MDDRALLNGAERVETYIKDVYGLRIVTRDIPDPLTGDLNGADIHIDRAVTPEERLFLLGHLFGHTVQWNTDPNARPQLHDPFQSWSDSISCVTIPAQCDASGQ
jgi:hypothetical protein